jgi:phosphonate transport system substrate-binding protein
MRKPAVLSAILLFVVFLAAAQTNDQIHFYLTPSVSKKTLEKQGKILKDYLEKETGFPMTLGIPKSYDELVEKFGTTKNAFGLMSSQSYILAHERYGATVRLRTVRYGQSVYFGMIITKASSQIKKIKDLNGKTVAYTDELSTSGYLYPKKILDRNKVTPSKETFAKTHDEVVRLVYEGKVDAGAAYFSPPAPDGTIRDARMKLQAKHKDIEQKVIILEKTEAIPNDPIVFTKGFNDANARKIYTALIKFAATPEGKQALLDLYGTEGFVKASDSDYNSLRQVVIKK